MRTPITGGAVISMNPATGDLERGDVLPEDDVIADIAEHIDPSDAVVIDTSDRGHAWLREHPRQVRPAELELRDAPLCPPGPGSTVCRQRVLPARSCR